MVAEGIGAILPTYADIAVGATLSNAQTAIGKLEALAPKVVLMDLTMSGLSGQTATELILERRPKTRILVLSMHDSPEYIATALGHGARGYFRKEVPTEEIKRAIDAVMQGARYLCKGAGGARAPSAVGMRDRLTTAGRGLICSWRRAGPTRRWRRRSAPRCARSKRLEKPSSASSASAVPPGCPVTRWRIACCRAPAPGA